MKIGSIQKNYSFCQSRAFMNSSSVNSRTLAASLFAFQIWSSLLLKPRVYPEFQLWETDFDHRYFTPKNMYDQNPAARTLQNLQYILRKLYFLECIPKWAHFFRNTSTSFDCFCMIIFNSELIFLNLFFSFSISLYSCFLTSPISRLRRSASFSSFLYFFT